MTLSQRISELLTENNLSAEALGKVLCISGSIVCRWKRKDMSIKLKHLLKIAEYFNCSVDFLCGRTEKENFFNHNAEIIFAQRLKQLIATSNLPIEQIAKQIQVDRNSIYEWYNGCQPLSSSLVLLADYFHCSVDYLLGLED